MKKKIYYVDENDLDGQRWAARAIDFGVGLSVTAAINCLYYAYGCLLERRDLFRLKAKRWGNCAVDAAGRMENRIKSIMQDKSYWEESFLKQFSSLSVTLCQQPLNMISKLL